LITDKLRADSNKPATDGAGEGSSVSVASVAGAGASAFSRAPLAWLIYHITHDRARSPLGRAPNPVYVLVGATLLTVLIVWLYRYAPRFGIQAEWLFSKEGAFEHLTFIAELAAAVLLIIAARRTLSIDRKVAVLYAIGGSVLFVGGMEEIGWGQQLFHFSTPEQWAAINHQQETTLHNLMSREALTSSARWIAYAFAAGAIGFSLVGLRTNRPILMAIAPHPSLIPSAAATAFAGWKTHPEVVEVVMALYALFYSYRIFVLTAPPSVTARSLRPGSTVDTANSSDSESSVVATRLLITGATGFIGSRLALYARQQHIPFVAVGMINTSVEQARLRQLQGAGINVLVGNLRDAAFARSAVEGCDVVIHLAAAQHESNVSEQYFHDVNVHATRCLLDACVAAKVSRFVHGSTIGVYGSADGYRLDENSPLRPLNPYGRSKLRAEALVREYADRIETTIVRISETYGPGDMRLLKLFRTIARGRFLMLGSGANTRQPIHVRDLLRGLLLAARHSGAVGETFLFAGKEVLSTRYMVDEVARALERRSPKRHVPIAPVMFAARIMEAVFVPFGISPPLHRRRLDFFLKSFEFSTEKAKALLGFEASIPFAAGARETLDWYRGEGLLPGVTLQAQPKLTGTEDCTGSHAPKATNVTATD
jgi:nucleoside-diphosphate-sugar epimerase